MALAAVGWPGGVERSKRFSASADGVAGEVLTSQRSDLVLWTGHPTIDTGTATVVFEVVADFDLTGSVAHPKGRTTLTVDGKRARLELQLTGGARGKALLEGPGERLLTLLVTGEPTPPPPGARRFAAGQVHDTGLLDVRSGETVWIEPGAVLRGGLRLAGDDITVGGGGLIDARDLRKLGHGRTLIADTCRNLRLGSDGGLIVINPPTWQVVLGNCSDVTVQHLTLLGLGLGTDGVDIVGCQRVRVSDCFIVCGDDCFVVKAFGQSHGRNREIGDWAKSVDDVTFEHSIIGNYLGGSALEIGHELPVPHVRNIVFRDIDVMFVHNHGSVYGIHHADSALIEDVRFEKIRVAHCYDKLIDFRVIRSRWSKGDSRGCVRRVLLDDCDWSTTIFNPGYTTSQIGGYDAEHRIEDVVFRDFRVDGKPITSTDEIELHTRHVNNITVEAANRRT